MTPSLQPRPIAPDELSDQFALQRLNFTYAHGIDRRDLALVRSLYHDDAIDDHGAMFCGPVDAYIAWLPSILAKWQVTSHRMANMLFLIDGDRAEGEVAFSAYHRTLDGTREWTAHGRYLDRYEKREGVWRYAHRSLVVDWTEKGAVSVQPDPIDPVDPCYARLDLFAAQRRT
jgi:hypothetical protein